MINLEIPRKFEFLVGQAHQVATEIFRLELAQVRRGRARVPQGARHARRGHRRHERGRRARAAPAPAGWARVGNGKADRAGNRNGSNMASLLGLIELCWGDVGLLLTMPKQGLGQAAIAAVANEEQLKRFGGKWAAMAITEPEAGSDSAAIRTTATLDGDEYVLNGEKIFVTAGDRAELIVVWATLDRNAGPRRDQVVRRRARQPGAEARPPRAQARHPRLRHRQLRASTTAASRRRTCSASPEIDAQGRLRRRHADVRQHPPAGRRRWPSASRARASSARANCSTEAGIEIDYDAPPHVAVRRRLRVHRDGVRLGGRAPADAAGRLDGRQQEAQLAPGVDGQGQGGARRHRHRAALRRAVPAPSATARASCSRSGPATPRSSTCSRAPSRSSC